MKAQLLRKSSLTFNRPRHQGHRSSWSSSLSIAHKNISCQPNASRVLRLPPARASSLLRAPRCYLAQLGAAIEAIHCGITTVFDHSHIQLSEEYIQQCIKASIESRTRSIYYFGLYSLPVSINPLKLPNESLVLHQRQFELFYKLSD